MNLTWYRHQQDGTTTILGVGEGEDDSPGLQALQEAVGGLIERIPDYYMTNQRNQLPYEVMLSVDGQDFKGVLYEIYVNEESKLPLFAITDPDPVKERELRKAYVAENINDFSFVMQPHDFILGDIVVCLANVEVIE